jgi:hypothetical protein
MHKVQYSRRLALALLVGWLAAFTGIVGWVGSCVRDMGWACDL